MRNTFPRTHMQNGWFNFFVTAHCPLFHLYLAVQKYEPLFPLSTYPWSFYCPPLPFPLPTMASSSPLLPIMDFSCDVRKRYLLLECIDCFNGREQRAKKEEKEGTGGQRRERPESISLIRALDMHGHTQAHTWYARTYAHSYIWLPSSYGMTAVR